MTEEIQIRAARLEDSHALMVLLRDIGWFGRMKNEPEAMTQQFVTQHLETCITNPDHSVYVATNKNDQLMGYVSVHWLPYLFMTGVEGFVSELFVADGARGSGAGKSLLAVVEEEAKERGCSRLQLINFRHRESYQRRFYEKAGWEERPTAASFVRFLEA